MGGEEYSALIHNGRQPKKTRTIVPVFYFSEWWAWMDLNQRPRSYQDRALAT